ncbi:uncharacterized protein SRS1_10336 [Sporisorium reilianum f. sp. reilianum]|uniref:Uncharacterized protein n=1 Tax=Sporisorium reilianum f. sp. reilianum TaxID=72559 RepID=A0A2N8U8F0_9BASI|nr:uncharacterized protein SRS1_10336 [Sporisorium reilianum f. sp. reilianum]
MGERSSSLLAKLTLRTKRQGTGSSSTSTRSAPSAVTTPETETPTTSFSGQADYGLGYSSINHERSPTYSAKRTSTALLTRPVEFDRYAEPSSSHQRREQALRTRSLPRSNKLSVVHAEEEPLFVQIVDQAAPTSPIQSTVRARSQSGTLPLHSANFDFARPQSPFAINSASQTRPTPRRCQSSFALASSADEPLAQASTPSFYAVGRGWKKGVYTTKEDAERQIRNVRVPLKTSSVANKLRVLTFLSHPFVCFFVQFPGPLMQVFRDRAAADDFLQNSGRFTPQSPSQDENEDEFIERIRIFKGLNPDSDLAKRRTLSINTERTEAQRRSRMLRSAPSPVSRQDACASGQVAAAAVLSSPPPSLRGIFAEIAPVSPIEEIDGFSDLANSAPLSGMTLLPVQHLANSMAFYARVLDFACIAHVPDVQAVMSTPAVTVCLRTLAQAPPSLNGAKLVRNTSATTPTLPTMSEEPHSDTDLALPPTPDSLSLSCTDPEPMQLPPTNLPLRSVTLTTLSGITVLLEHGGALEALHSRLTAKLNEWRIERTKAAHSRISTDGAKLLGGVQQTPWDAQELHLCDLDGHRIIYTTPLLRGSAASGPL